MTYLEVFKQAMREYGDDDATIERRVQQAKELMPLPDKEHVPEEKVRACIDELVAMRKAIKAMMDKNPAATVAAIGEKLRQYNQKN